MISPSDPQRFFIIHFASDKDVLAIRQLFPAEEWSLWFLLVAGGYGRAIQV